MINCRLIYNFSILGKKLTELILPVNDRIQGVKDFLTDIDTSISYTIVPIHDMYGPTATDPNLDVSIRRFQNVVDSL